MKTKGPLFHVEKLRLFGHVIKEGTRCCSSGVRGDSLC